MIVRPPEGTATEGAAALYAHAPEMREAWMNTIGVACAFTTVSDLIQDVQRLRSAFFHGCGF